MSVGRLPNRIFGDTEKAWAIPQISTWAFIIQEYSGREMSNPKDRLPALAGLAAELYKVWGGKYLAGMWQSCLVGHLGWERVLPANKMPLATSRPPTWSWASHDGEVFLRRLREEVAELLDAAVTPYDVSVTFGAVLDGRIVLRAPALPGDTELDPGAMNMDYDSPGSGRLPVEAKFLLLGYLELGGSPTGLILTPIGDGTFVRVGMFIDRQTERWAADGVPPETITIV